MPPDWIVPAQLLESAMLLCFGASWPLSIMRSLRARSVEGKSVAFLALIFVGYLSGILAKCARAIPLGHWPETVTLLYALNAVLVAVDICVYVHFRKRPAAAQRIINY